MNILYSFYQRFQPHIFQPIFYNKNYLGVMETKVDGVFEGGGVRGIGFVGAICCLEENKSD